MSRTSHQVAKYWSCSFSINPSSEFSGLISFRMDWFDLLAVQGTLKSLLQHHNSKASVLGFPYSFCPKNCKFHTSACLSLLLCFTSQSLNPPMRSDWPLSSPLAYSLTPAAAKSLQSCPTLCNPIDGSPPGSPVPGILQARTLEWVAISFSNAGKWKVKVKLLSRVWLLATPWTAAHLSSLYSSSQWVPLPSPV